MRQFSVECAIWSEHAMVGKEYVYANNKTWGKNWLLISFWKQFFNCEQIIKMPKEQQ